MKLNYVATLLATLLTNYFKCVQSIKCYQCRSEIDDQCDENKVKIDYLSECSSKVSDEEPFCRKMSQYIYFTVESRRSTIRECAYVHSDQDECFKSPWRDSKIYTCDCKAEGCNKGTIKKAPAFMWWTLFLIFWYFGAIT